MERSSLPVLLMVIAKELDEPPVLMLPKLCVVGEGVTWMSGAGAMPVPWNEKVTEGVSGSFDPMVRVADCTPVSCGVKETPRVRPSLGGMVAGGVPTGCAPA